MNGTGLRIIAMKRICHFASGLENLYHWSTTCQCGLRINVLRSIAKLDYTDVMDIFAVWGMFVFLRLANRSLVRSTLSGKSLFIWCMPAGFIWWLPRWRVLFEFSMQTQHFLYHSCIPDTRLVLWCLQHCNSSTGCWPILSIGEVWLRKQSKQTILWTIDHFGVYMCVSYHPPAFCDDSTLQLTSICPSFLTVAKTRLSGLIPLISIHFIHRSV